MYFRSESRNEIPVQIASSSCMSKILNNGKHKGKSFIIRNSNYRGNKVRSQDIIKTTETLFKFSRVARYIYIISSFSCWKIDRDNVCVYLLNQALFENKT